LIFEEYKFYVKYDYSIALRNFRGKTFEYMQQKNVHKETIELI
ncbi:MAG: N-ethylammeline chlorohydrolase, partial [Streptococcus sp. DORA_10]